MLLKTVCVLYFLWPIVFTGVYEPPSFYYTTLYTPSSQNEEAGVVHSRTAVYSIQGVIIKY